VKKFWVHFPDFCVSKQSCLPWSSDAFFELSASKVYKNVLGAFSRFLCAKTKLLAVKSRRILEVFTSQVKKSSGRIFSIFASKNESVSREVQTLFGSSLPASFTEKVLGAISRIVCPKTKRFAVKFRPILEVLCLARFIKKVLDPFSRFMRPKVKLFAVGFRCIVDVLRLQGLQQKVLGAISRFVRPKTKLFAVKFRRILELLCLQVLQKEVPGAMSRCICSKTKRFAMKFRRILEVFALQGLQKKLWAHFHDLCVQKRSCLPWNSDAYWKFSTCNFYRKSCGSNFTICASKNEAVCREIQTHSGSSLPASFTEKVVGAIPRFVRPKTKLFAVKFRRISEVLRLQDLQRKFWARFHDVCVQKRSCLLWNSGAFWRFSVCMNDKKAVGAFSRFNVSRKQTFLTSTFCKNDLATFYNFHAHKSLLGCSGTLWSSWFSHFIRMLWIWTHLDCECTHKLWRASVTLCEAISNKSWTGTSDMFCNILTLKRMNRFCEIWPEVRCLAKLSWVVHRGL